MCKESVLWSSLLLFNLRYFMGHSQTWEVHKKKRRRKKKCGQGVWYDGGKYKEKKQVVSLYMAGSWLAAALTDTVD